MKWYCFPLANKLCADTVPVSAGISFCVGLLFRGCRGGSRAVRAGRCTLSESASGLNCIGGAGALSMM